MTDSTHPPHPEQLLIDRLLTIAREYEARGQMRAFDDLLANIEATIERRLADEALVGIKAMLLAPNIDTCRALLRGERVHWTQLDYFNSQRYGIREGHAHADGRLALEDFNDVRAPAHSVNGK